MTLFWVLFACYFWKYAWVTEDAFINFRVIDRVRAGEGFTWNPGERVQVFTSALWMLLTTGVSLITGEDVWTTLGLSFVLATVTLWILYRICFDRLPVFLTLAALFLSTVSVRDYLSSGLETPLLMCSLAMFFYFWREEEADWLWLCFCASACLLVRHDSVVILGPFLSAAFYQIRPWRSGALMRFVFLRAFLGFAPFFAWSLFSLAYYGSPFPNTAGAKIVQGYDHVSQGFHYLGFMQSFDPLGFWFLLGGVLALGVFRLPGFSPASLALILFFLYVLKVGGDYMAGRFFVGPVVMCVFLLAKNSRPIQSFFVAGLPGGNRRLALVGVLSIFALQALSPVSVSALNPGGQAFVFGIADERQYYYGSTDVNTLAANGPQHRFRDGVAKLRSKVVISCNIGMLGYYSSADVYLIDPLALSDRFLVGMPIVSPDVRVGHFERVVPSDYVESILVGGNRFEDPALRRYYDDIRLIVAGDLFTLERWRAIWRSLTRVHEDWLRDVDVESGRLQVKASVDRVSQKLNCLGSGGRLIEPVEQGGKVALRVL